MGLTMRPAIEVLAKCSLLLFVLALLNLKAEAQEKLAIDVDDSGAALPMHVEGIASSIDVPSPRGTTHGIQEPPPPGLTLSIVGLSFPTPAKDTARLDRPQLRFEMRLTNSGRVPIEVPANADLGATYRNCVAGYERHVALVLKFRDDRNREKWLEMRADWAGCPSFKASLVKLNPNEWITYRGSARFPTGLAPPGSVTASWLASDLSYLKTSDGLIENRKTTLIVNSEGKLVP